MLITGAGGGIGGRCVTTFAAAAPEEPILAWTRVHAAVPTHPNVEAVTGDLVTSDVSGVLTSALAGRGLRAVIASHGLTGAGALETVTPEYSRQVLQANFGSVVRLFEAVRPHLLANALFIVVSSQAGLIGEAANSAYCASKFAVLGWLRAMNRDAKTSVRLCGLCPGATDTRMLRTAIGRFAAAENVSVEEYNRTRVLRIAAGRYGDPSEIAAAALYLASAPTPPEILAVTGGDALY